MHDDVESLKGALMPPAIFDISLPVGSMKSYVGGLEAALEEAFPGARLMVFGNLGDGNLHLAIGPAPDRHGVENLVYERLQAVNGSISAWHGIGLERGAFLKHSRSPEEPALMRSIKATLDPGIILNPGSIL